MYYVPIEMTKEYVRKNKIYTTVNGEIIRITPDMIKKIIRNGIVTEVYFSEVESKEVYDEYMRSVWREEKTLEREDRCMVSNSKGKIVRCTGNCASCEHRNENSMLSIETAEENGSLNIIKMQDLIQSLKMQNSSKLYGKELMSFVMKIRLSLKCSVTE